MSKEKMAAVAAACASTLQHVNSQVYLLLKVHHLSMLSIFFICEEY